jgi:diguanylate cyclase (GGDEF)-like protein/PAS domain S-box-containing protein
MIRRTRTPPSLAQRFFLIFLSLLTGGVLVTALLTGLSVRHALDVQRDTARTLAAAATDAWALRESDTTRVHALLRQLAGNPALAAVTIREQNDAPAFVHVRDRDPGDWLTRLYVADDERRVHQNLSGNDHDLRLELVLSWRPLADAAWQAVWGAMALIATVLLGTAIFARNLLARFAAPVRSLAAWAREFARGDNWKNPPPETASRYREILDLRQALVEGGSAVRHHLQRLEETHELLDHSEQRLTRLMNGMPVAVFELDPEGRLRYLNPAWERLTGFTVLESLGRPLTDFFLDEESQYELDPARIERLELRDREVRLRHTSGKRLWASLTASARFGSGAGVIGMVADVTERVELSRLLARYQDEFYQLSVTDPLTGLYNRRHFDRHLETILADSLPQNQPACLLLIDLDGFKFINDTYGHPFGDEILRTTSHLLRDQVRRNDYVARLAGDEFAMVLKNTDLASATTIARKLHGQIAETRVALPVGHMHLQSSIGVAEAPTHAHNAGELVSAADIALYHSKRRGRNRVETLSPDMSKEVMSLFRQGFRLRHALDEGYLIPAFQPIYDLRHERAVAVEVLARMRLDGTVIHAKDFIAIAEELGLTRELDLIIIRRALELAPPGQALFLNVDISSFNDREFVQDLKHLLAPARATGREITIEITERETVAISDSLLGDISSLRALGCRLALDDFGSGYSTYHFLNQFRPDYLKIEGSFVRDMLDSEAAHKIVAHIHELARSFGMETIAECVESEAVSQRLRAIGVHNVQGRLYGEPVLAAA